jgi:hypothetical protein
MSEPLPPPSLARAREQKVSELSEHFANDDLSLEDLERRIERVYKAASIAEIDQVTSDLRALVPVNEPAAKKSKKEPTVMPSVVDAAGVPAPGYEIPYSRIAAIMSSVRRVGRWAVPRDLRLLAIMTDSKFDMTKAALPVGGVVNIDLTGIMASVKIIVPPGIRVINEIHSFMADVGSGADELDAESTGTSPIIRLTGTAFMSEVKVKVRRREDPVYGDDD